MSEEHSFDRLAAFARQHGQPTAEAGFEEGRLRYTLTALGLNAAREAGLLIDMPDGLSFRSFNSRWPAFPFLVGTSTLNGAQLHLDPRTFWPACFNRFDAVPFVVAFDDFCRQNAGADPRGLALVVRRRGIPHGLVIYRGQGCRLLEGAPVLYAPAGTRRNPEPLYVGRYQDLLASVRAHCDWRGGSEP